MDLLKTGAIIGVVVGFWDKIKSFIWLLLSIFIEKVEIKTEDIHNEVIGYLAKNHKSFKNYNKVYGSQYESFRNGKYGLVPFEKFGESTMIFLSNKKYFFKLIRIPFVFSKNNVSLAGGEINKEQKDTTNNFSNIISIRGLLI